MSSRARVYLVVAVAALAAAGGAVGVTLATRTTPPQVVKQKGPPPLKLDLGLRTDAEATALRQGLTLYGKGKLDQAGAIFDRYSSLEAQVGSALAQWPDGTIATLQGLATNYPRSALVRLNLGLAQFWDGSTGAATSAWQAARRLGPDSYYGVTADSLLHPRFAPDLPPFTTARSLPAAIGKLAPAQQLAALEAGAKDDPVLRLLYGSYLQRLDHPVSAEKQFALAAKALPDDPEAQVAAAVGEFSKAQPAKAFSQLGPLAKRFPKAATVRFHLGLLLLWTADVKDARVQLRKALSLDPSGPLAPSARAFLARLGKS
jgi:tetratricopeptide (TPR) repeat protein